MFPRIQGFRAGDRRQRLLGRVVRFGPLVALGLVLALDVVLVRTTSYALNGLVDEPAHLLTTLIGISAVAAVAGDAVSRTWMVAAVLAGNLIDVDHLPAILGSDILTDGTPRPYPHSMTTIVLLIALAPLLGARGAAVARGAAFGVGAHLVRDLATAPVALFWPLSRRPVEIPYSAYVLTLLVLAVVPLLRRGPRAEDPYPTRSPAR